MEQIKNRFTGEVMCGGFYKCRDGSNVYMKYRTNSPDLFGGSNNNLYGKDGKAAHGSGDQDIVETMPTPNTLHDVVLFCAGEAYEAQEKSE